MSGSQAIDLTGQRFGQLVVMYRIANIGNAVRWKCQCDCGNQADVRSWSLRAGRAQSCGCLRRRRASQAATTHGHSTTRGLTPTYRSWRSMKDRCTNPNARAYPRYGGRGIEICNRWLSSFENFLADMGERPEGTTLDRYPDNDGNYEPGNCRWATRGEQEANKRRRS